MSKFAAQRWYFGRVVVERGIYLNLSMPDQRCNQVETKSVELPFSPRSASKANPSRLKSFSWCEVEDRGVFGAEVLGEVCSRF